MRLAMPATLIRRPLTVTASPGGAPSPFTWAEIAATTRTTFALLESVRSGGGVRVDALR